jgi:3-methyladenine DNA glycosylase AlkD
MRHAVAEDCAGGASRLKYGQKDVVAEVVNEMRSLAGKGDPQAAIAGMRRFGIQPENALGLNVPHLRAIARRLGRDQKLAEKLWETGIHDARILASLVADPAAITREVMERWAGDFASWDICDACCGNVFDRSPYAWSQIRKWAPRNEEFVRRASFALIAIVAVHDKKADDAVFLKALPLIERYAFDERNFVKKAVNWALRNIGKRNSSLRMAAMACAERIKAQGTPSARWIAADALRELKLR